MTQNFRRKKEDFVCGHCGEQVAGNGYTNHCPACLWSRHVDESPGDRAEGCGGLMRPERVDLEKGEYIISHICESCRAKKRVKAVPPDDISGYLRSVL